MKMKLNSHVHAALTFVGLDPETVMRNIVADRSVDFDDCVDLAGILNAAKPGHDFYQVDIFFDFEEGIISLTGMIGNDAISNVEIISGDDEVDCVRFPAHDGTDFATAVFNNEFAHLEAGLPDGSSTPGKTVMLDEIRQPFGGKPGFIANGTCTMVNPRRRMIETFCLITYVEVDVSTPLARAA